LRETIIAIPSGRDSQIILYLRLCPDRMQKYPTKPRMWIVKVGTTTKNLLERDACEKDADLKGMSIIPVATLLGYTEQ
jgi:hypothetical protein